MAGRRSSVSRTMEIAAARERRRRRLFFSVLTALLLAVSLGALYWFVVRDLPLFEIREIEITGLETGSAEADRAAEAIRTTTGGMTTLHVDQGRLDEEMERFPRVESAQIEADFPNAATVAVSEREDGAVFGEGSEALLIATDGTVLGPAGEGLGQLPTITEGDPPEGDRLDGIALKQAIVLGAAPPELRSYVDRSEVTGRGVEVTLSTGMILLFGEAGQSSRKWKAAAAVISDPALEDAGYVDLSVPRRPAVSQERPRGQ